MHKTLDERTDPGWPTTWFAPRLTGKGAFTDVYSVMANMGANHGAFTYGHIGADILTLASMLRIPVYAHNIPDDQIYRPSAWGLHGTAAPGRRRLPRLRQLAPAVRQILAADLFIRGRNSSPDDVQR